MTRYSYLLARLTGQTCKFRRRGDDLDSWRKHLTRTNRSSKVKLMPKKGEISPRRTHYYCRYCGEPFYAREFWKHCAQCAKNPKNAPKGSPKRGTMANPLRVQRKYKLLQYGLTEESYEALLDSQGGGCAICGKPPNMQAHPNQQFLAVDHVHDGTPSAKKNVRGILCSNCNHGIGKFRDDPALLIRAALYLRSHTPLRCIS